MLIPVMAGAATGAALNGKDPLMGALMGGLGGYGGAGIGNALGASGAASGATSGAAGANSLATPTVSTAMESGSMIPGADAMSSASATGKLTSFMPDAGAAGAASQAAPTFGQMGRGIANLGNSAGRDAFIKSLGGTGPNADLMAAGKVALPLGMAGLAGIEPPKMPQEKEDTYDPRATLNLNTDSGLRFFAEGGDVNETPDPDSNPAEYQSGRYGVPMLNKSVGGIASFARGGYLDGPGDGMSDSIPATIEGKQPARLADGEFIVPADVVSHLGNGSTKAGAQRLYSMMDKIRHARTGTTQQGKQINPKKYLPA
jgi:hypothetical protein